MNLQMPIPGAPNFTYAELCASVTAQRMGISNVPGPAELFRMGLVATQLAQPARNKVGRIKTSSGFRSEDLNRAVGGAPDSAHKYAAAGDFVPKLVSCAKLALVMYDNAVEFDQIIWERAIRNGEIVEWVHAAVWPHGERPNRRLLRKHFPGDGVRYPEIAREFLLLSITED